MAKSTSERQATYRKNRVSAGENRDGERRINTWVSSGTLLALTRLSNRYCVTKRALIERLVSEADQKIIASLEMDTGEWNAYFNVTQ